jgi:hypothetical protein
LRQDGALDQDCPVAELGTAEVVGRDQQDPAFVTKLLEQLDDRRLGFHVDPGEWLVQQDDLASCASARARNTRFFCPPESSPIWRLRNSVMPTRSSESVTAARSLRPWHAQKVHVAIAAHHHHVFDQHGEIPVDFLCLRHVGHVIAFSACCRPSENVTLPLASGTKPMSALNSVDLPCR